MAIIREKQNFQIGTIGVARASESGRITGQAITQSANKIGGMLFEKAADEAQKAGLELGQSVDREQVIAINPQTGEPEAYDPPEGMGSIAADAYQRVVMNRFQRSIEDEIQNKARELSVQYEDNPNGVALYTEAMSEYISSMTNVAQDEFKGYISDVGTTYLNSTRTSMAAAQLRRERAAARRAQKDAINDGLDSLFNAFRTGGPSSLSSDESDPTLANVLNSGLTETINTSAQAGVITDEEASDYNVDQSLAAVTGLISFYASQEDADPEQLNKLRLAIGMRTPSAIPTEFAGVAELYQGILGNRQAMGKADSYSNSVLADAITLSRIFQNEEQERINAENNLRILRGGASLPAQLSTEEQSARTQNIRAITALAIDGWNERQALIEGYLQSEDTASLQFEQQRQNAFIASTTEGLISRALNGLDSQDVFKVQEAISNRDPDLAPTDESRKVLSALMDIQGATGVLVLDQFNSAANSYGSGGARAVEMREQAVALGKLEAAIDFDAISFSDNPAEAANAAQNLLGEIDNLPSQVREGTQNQINYAAATGLVNQLFSDETLTERQLNQLSTAIEEGSPIPSDVFSEEQTSLLQSIASFSKASGDPSGIQSLVGRLSEDRKLEIAAQAAQRQEQVLQTVVANGGGNPADAGDREAADRIARKNTGIDFAVTPQLFSNPDFLNSPQGQIYLNNALTMNVLPEPLYEAMTQFANGQFTGDIGEFSKVIRNFENINYYGQIMTSPAFRALPPEAQATLSYFSDVTETLGSEDQTALAEAYRQYQQYKDDPLFEKRVDTVLDLDEDNTLLDYVYSIKDGAWFTEGTDEAPFSTANNLSAMALRYVALGLDKSDITSKLEEQLDKTYVVSSEVVNVNGGNRTMFALEITENITGFESVFKQFVLDEVAKSNPELSNVTFPINLSIGQKFVTGIGSVKAGTARALATGVGYFTSPESTVPSGRPQQVQIFLRPLPQSAGDDVQYTVHMVTPDGVTREITKEYGASPVTESFRAPLIVSNRDPLFLQQRQILIDTKKAEDVAAGQRILDAQARAAEFRSIPAGGNRSPIRPGMGD